MDARHPGLFPPDAVIRVVDRESALMLGATCAVLMQFAHPLAAAGVADHSNFRRQPVRRVRRTMDLTLGMVFGTREEALAAAARITAVHQQVTGVADGMPYAATDPELLLWVHATLVYSALKTYEQFVRPLTDTQRFEYYEQSTVVARMLGIADEFFASSWAGFQDYLRQMLAGPIRVTDRARALAAQVLYPFPFVPRQLYAPFTAITAGLLPPTVRAGYRLAWGRPQQILIRVTEAVLPPLIARAPTAVRSLPQARLRRRASG